MLCHIQLVVRLWNQSYASYAINVIKYIPFLWLVHSFIPVHDHLGVSENVVYPIVPNGFADQTIPMKNG